MATERLSMRHTREVLRQKWALGWSHREVARSLGISTEAVGTTVVRARAAGLNWIQVEPLSDEALEGRVYGLCLRLQRPIMSDYVTLRRPTHGAAAARGRSC